MHQGGEQKVHFAAMKRSTVASPTQPHTLMPGRQYDQDHTHTSKSVTARFGGPPGKEKSTRQAENARRRRAPRSPPLPRSPTHSREPAASRRVRRAHARLRRRNGRRCGRCAAQRVPPNGKGGSEPSSSRRARRAPSRRAPSAGARPARPRRSFRARGARARHASAAAASSATTPIKANAREAGDGGGRARSDPSQPTRTLRTVGAEARLSASREDHHPAPLGCARRHDFSVSAPFVASDRERGRREIGDRNRRVRIALAVLWLCATSPGVPPIKFTISVSTRILVPKAVTHFRAVNDRVNGKKSRTRAHGRLTHVSGKQSACSFCPRGARSA